MRVLRVDSWEGEIGGGQVYVRSVADVLTEQGHPQRLLNLVTERPAVARPDEEYLVNAPTARGRVLADLGASSSFEAEFRRACAEFEPDLIHLHRFDTMFTPIARALGDLDIPIVFTAHDAEIVCPISTLIQPGAVVCDGGVRFRCLWTGCQVGWGGPYNLWQSRVFDRQLAPKIAAFLCPSSLLTTYLHRNHYRPAVHLPPFARIPDAVRRAPYDPPAA
ncbi:MAG: glycosyltransferase, partial [Thermoplasmata archaeon]|nr:glycosyltransferase [Thermoplasmata archaeon]